MILTITDVDTFRKIASSLTKFVDKAVFNFSKEGLRIRSIDSEDFCYVDLVLKIPFFTEIQDPLNLTLLLDISGLTKMLRAISKEKEISLVVDKEALRIASSGEGVVFRISGRVEDPLLDIPEPKRPHFTIESTTASNDFMDSVKGAAAIANEIGVQLLEKSLVLTASHGDYSYEARLEARIEFEAPTKQVSSQVLVKYLKAIEPLIKLSDVVKLCGGSEEPIQIRLNYNDAATFSFSLAPRRTRRLRKQSGRRRGDSLPRITASRFPKYVLYLAAFPNGAAIAEMKRAGLETAGNDYTRLATKLQFVRRSRSGNALNDAGAQFAGFLKVDREMARNYLHGTLMKQIPAYGILISAVADRHIEADDLYEKVRAALSENQDSIIDRQDFATITGLASWCGYLDRRLGTIFSPVQM